MKQKGPPLLAADVGWDLKAPCGDCPFRRDAPDHQGVCANIPGYFETIESGRFAHTCHKTDNREACDGPRNYRGEKTQHCAGALHFVIRSGLDLQLPLLNAAEAGKFDIGEATARALQDESVFGSAAELLEYYAAMARRILNLEIVT